MKVAFVGFVKESELEKVKLKLAVSLKEMYPKVTGMKIMDIEDMKDKNRY